MISKILNPGIVAASNTKVSTDFDTSPTGSRYSQAQQVVSDYSTAAKEKLQGELADKLSADKLATKFSNLSSDINLKHINDKIFATSSGTGQALAALQDVASSDIAASSLAQAAADASSSDFKVKLEALPSLGGDVVVFDVMPSLSEEHSASYDSVDLIHHPGQILKYKGTNARGWGLTADFVSRTVGEADKNLHYLNIIRSWVMPFYGNGTADNPLTADKLGGPPQILILTAYGPKMVGPVTCVLESINWTFENDIDYIRTSNNTPFPVHIKLSLSLKETWTPSQFTSFDLMSYRAGSIGAAFGQPAAGQASPNTSTAGAVAGMGKIDTSTGTFISPLAANIASSANNAAAGIPNGVPTVITDIYPPGGGTPAGMGILNPPPKG